MTDSFEDVPPCAHLRVEYRDLDDERDGTTTFWWECTDCHTHFAPVLWKARERLAVRARQVANLRRGIKQLQRAFHLRDLMMHRSFEDRRLALQRVADLQKENAELRRKLVALGGSHD